MSLKTFLQDKRPTSSYILGSLGVLLFAWVCVAVTFVARNEHMFRGLTPVGQYFVAFGHVLAMVAYIIVCVLLLTKYTLNSLIQFKKSLLNIELFVDACLCSYMLGKGDVFKNNGMNAIVYILIVIKSFLRLLIELPKFNESNKKLYYGMLVYFLISYVSSVIQLYLIVDDTNWDESTPPEKLSQIIWRGIMTIVLFINTFLFVRKFKKNKLKT